MLYAEPIALSLRTLRLLLEDLARRTPVRQLSMSEMREVLQPLALESLPLGVLDTLSEAVDAAESSPGGVGGLTLKQLEQLLTRVQNSG